MSRIITIYVAEGAPRQLNLSSKDRANVLHALEITTHPSAFRNVISTVEWTLRRQSHPNFIRWTICNGNRPRVIFARGLGIAGILGGIITGILLCLSSAGRGWRVMALIPFMIGIPTLIAAWKGMCVVLHGMHHRHLRPWELFEGEDIDEGLKEEKESFDSTRPNSYEDEPWVVKYQKRNITRKIFDREVWIQEPALRQIQDTIFVQALIGAFIISAILVGIFCAVPHGDFY
jgi:MFS family permease